MPAGGLPGQVLGIDNAGNPAWVNGGGNGSGDSGDAIIPRYISPWKNLCKNEFTSYGDIYRRSGSAKHLNFFGDPTQIQMYSYDRDYLWMYYKGPTSWDVQVYEEVSDVTEAASLTIIVPFTSIDTDAFKFGPDATSAEELDGIIPVYLPCDAYFNVKNSRYTSQGYTNLYDTLKYRAQVAEIKFGLASSTLDSAELRVTFDMSRWLDRLDTAGVIPSTGVGYAYAHFPVPRIYIDKK